MKSASMIINSYFQKDKFIIFDLNKLNDNLFIIQLKFNILLNL